MLSFYLTLTDSEIEKQLLENIYYNHKKKMFILAMTILENNADAEDTVHDIFCTLASKYMPVLQKLSEDEVKNYVLKATKNTALNIKRNKKGYVSLEENGSIISQLSDTNNDIFLDSVCDRITYEEAISAIKSLDEKYRDVLYLYFVIGLNTSEIARFLDKDADTVKKQFLRGKIKLMQIIKQG